MELKEAIRVLVEQKASPHTITSRFNDIYTADGDKDRERHRAALLCFAIHSRHNELVASLLESTATDLNFIALDNRNIAKAEELIAIMDIVCERDDDEILSMLLPTLSSQSPLPLFALKHKSEKCLKLLGRQQPACLSTSQKALLMAAAGSSPSYILAILVHECAILDRGYVTKRCQASSLHLCLYNGEGSNRNTLKCASKDTVKKVQLLLAAGADPSHKDSGGCLPLDCLVNQLVHVIQHAPPVREFEMHHRAVSRCFDLLLQEMKRRNVKSLGYTVPFNCFLNIHNCLMTLVCKQSYRDILTEHQLSIALPMELLSNMVTKALKARVQMSEPYQQSIHLSLIWKQVQTHIDDIVAVDDTRSLRCMYKNIVKLMAYGFKTSAEEHVVDAMSRVLERNVRFLRRAARRCISMMEQQDYNRCWERLHTADPSITKARSLQELCRVQLYKQLDLSVHRNMAEYIAPFGLSAKVALFLTFAVECRL